MKYCKEDMFIIPYQDNIFIFYAPLYGILMSVNREAAYIIKKYLNNELDENNAFLKKLISNFPSKQITPENNRIIDEFAPTTLGLALSTLCNLNCVYCHENAGANSNVMHWDIAKSAIDFVLGNCIKFKKNLNLRFLGGEPTMAWDLLVKCISYAKTNCYKHNISLQTYITITNAAFNKKKAKFIKENFKGFYISLDGLSEDHDFHRPFKNGKGSFSIVYQNAKYFYNNNVPFGIRVTVTNRNVNKLLGIVKFISKNFPNIELAFEPLVQIGRAEINQSSIYPPTHKNFCDNYLKALSYSVNNQIKIKNSLINHIMKPRTVYCNSITHPLMILTPTGEITCCSRKTSDKFFHFGKFDIDKNKFEFNLNKIKQLNRINVHLYDNCKECFCKYICAGDCEHLRQSGFNRCITNKEILKYHLANELGLLTKGE
ncbi:MAG: radical SAM protein [Ignavibacteriales bacterium]|nr:radical SAM protein [Ignavibacteriales bacterium]